MNSQNGYIWEITTSNDKKYRIFSLGHNLEEAVSEFHRVHGYSEILFKVKYFAKYGEVE